MGATFYLQCLGFSLWGLLLLQGMALGRLGSVGETAHAHPGWRPFFRPASSPLFVCWEAAEGTLAGSGVRAPKTDREQGCWGRWGPLLSTSVPPVQAPLLGRGITLIVTSWISLSRWEGRPLGDA